MSRIMKYARRYVFALALYSIGISVVIGAWWGLVYEWNPDQLAFDRLDTRHIIPRPSSYVRPPVVSYFHLYLSEAPINTLGAIIHAPNNLLSLLKLTWSKTLTAGIYISSVLLFYSIIKRFLHNSLYTKVLSILFGSSAGLIAYGHFLTADIPLMFCMLLSMFYIVKVIRDPSIVNYILAGLFCGVAAAVKYPGIILTVPLLGVFFVYPAVTPARYVMRRIWGFVALCVSVVSGFILGNPYVVIDFNDVYNTLFYLSQTNKYVNGDTLSVGYTLVLPRIIELIGYPATIAVGGLMLLSCIALAISKKTRSALFLFTVLNLSIVMPYILFMANSSILPARYVLPIIPNLFFLALPFFHFSAYKRKTVYITGSILSFIIIYNFLCVYQIDMRFVSDPRMRAYVWSFTNIPDYSKIELTEFTPNLNLAYNRHMMVTEIPHVVERSVSFRKLFTDNNKLQKMISQIYPLSDTEWFSVDSLYARNPDYILLNSWQYDDAYKSFPQVKDFYTKLLRENTKYQIVFDRKTPQMPPWSYPQDVDFLFNRMVILKNTDNEASL